MPLKLFGWRHALACVACLACLAACGTDVLDHESSGEDRDQDGLDDDVELGLGTNPEDPDTDDDGLLDGAEVEQDLDPLDPESN